MDAWRTSIGAQLRSEAGSQVTADRMLVATGVDSDSLDISGAPVDAVLVLRDVPHRFVLQCGIPGSPEKVIIQPQLEGDTEITLDWPSGDQRARPPLIVREVEVYQRLRRGKVRITGDAAPLRLTLAHGEFDLGSVRLRRLRTEYCTILKTESPIRVDLLELEGTVSFNTQVIASRSRVNPTSLPVFVEADHSIDLGSVESAPTGVLGMPAIILKLRVEAATIRWIPASSHIILLGRLELSEDVLDRPIQNLAVEGLGRIQVTGHVNEPVFQPAELSTFNLFEFTRPLNTRDLDGLHVDNRGRIIDASGVISFSASPKSLLVGAPGGALKILEVGEVDEAEIERFSPYALSDIRDLTRLKSAARVTPWVPRRRIARQLEDSMQLGGATKQLTRAHFWSKLSGILRDTHAPGGLQADVRYAAARARRLASEPFSRERWLLNIYGLVGYGERIGRPLFFLLALSGIASAIHVGVNQRIGHIDAFLSYLFSPLTLFRLSDDLPGSIAVTGTAARTGLLLFKVVGAALIGFSVFAVARIAKPDKG